MNAHISTLKDSVASCYKSLLLCKTAENFQDYTDHDFHFCKIFHFDFQAEESPPSSKPRTRGTYKHTYQVISQEKKSQEQIHAGENLISNSHFFFFDVCRMGKASILENLCGAK